MTLRRRVSFQKDTCEMLGGERRLARRRRDISAPETARRPPGKTPNICGNRGGGTLRLRSGQAPAGPAGETPALQSAKHSDRFDRGAAEVCRESSIPGVANRGRVFECPEPRDLTVA